MVEKKTQRRCSKADGRDGAESDHPVGPPCDLIITTATGYSNLFSAQNPQWLRPVNKVLGIVLRWNHLDGLRLAKIKEEHSVVEDILEAW